MIRRDSSMRVVVYGGGGGGGVSRDRSIAENDSQVGFSLRAYSIHTRLCCSKRRQRRISRSRKSLLNLKANALFSRRPKARALLERPRDNLLLKANEKTLHVKF